MSKYLNLHDKNIRKSVISKLKLLDYDVKDDTEVRHIQDVVKDIQYKNGLIVDGLIGIQTMPLLGYRASEIKRLLKIRDYQQSPPEFPWWLLLC